LEALPEFNNTIEETGKIKEGNRKSDNTEQLIKVREINDYHHAKVFIDIQKALLN